MTRPKILITGSKGLIGKILTERLSGHFDIYGLDKGEDGDKYFQTDICNYEDLDSVLRKLEPVDCIVHLAGDSRVDADWESVLMNNIVGTRNLYECARRHGITKIVFASSTHVTGACRTSRRITVRDPIRPDGDYGSSKAFGEIIARQYSDLYGIKSICLRIGWVISDDDPTKEEELALKMWLSHRDLIDLITRSILSDIRFGVYYGVSNNRERFWHISDAEKDLGYKPKDDAYSLLTKSSSSATIADRLKRQIRTLLNYR